MTAASTHYTFELDRETDGRWIAAVPQLGAFAYGESADEATARVQALALRIVADRIEHGEMPSGAFTVTFVAS